MIAKYANWDGSHWKPVVDGDVMPDFATPAQGLSTCDATDLPAPRFQVRQQVRYRTALRPVKILDGEILRIYYRLADRQPYRSVMYTVSHIGHNACVEEDNILNVIIR